MNENESTELPPPPESVPPVDEDAEAIAAIEKLGAQYARVCELAKIGVRLQQELLQKPIHLISERTAELVVIKTVATMPEAQEYAKGLYEAKTKTLFTIRGDRLPTRRDPVRLVDIDGTEYLIAGEPKPEGPDGLFNADSFVDDAAPLHEGALADGV